MPETGTTNIFNVSSDSRGDAWKALMVRLLELAPKASVDELKDLTYAYRNLT